MWTLLQELRIAVRTLAQKPKFALLTILTLALGIGATTVVFTLISGVLLKPLTIPIPRVWSQFMYEPKTTGSAGVFLILIFSIPRAIADPSKTSPHGRTAAEQSAPRRLAGE